MNAEQWKRRMAYILGQLETLYSQDKIGAVQINMALRDGDICTLEAYDTGFRVLLVAAAAVGQQEAFEAVNAPRGRGMTCALYFKK